MGQLILKALKQAGVKPTCDNRGCSFVITNFVSYNETDGCGGGATGFGTSFTYADGKKYGVESCTREGGVTSSSTKNIAEGLEEIFCELGLSRTAGWRASINLTEVNCVTNSKKASAEDTFANLRCCASYFLRI